MCRLLVLCSRVTIGCAQESFLVTEGLNQGPQHVSKHLILSTLFPASQSLLITEYLCHVFFSNTMCGILKKKIKLPVRPEL